MVFRPLLSILMLFLFSLGCEEDINNDCIGCAGNSKEISSYKSIETSLLSSRRKAYSKIDSIVDTVKKNEDFVRLYIAFMDSIIRREAVAQVIPFYLKFNTLHATPPSIIFKYSQEKIDSISIYLQRFVSDTINEEIYFNKKFENYSSNLNSHNSFNSIDSIVNLSHELSDSKKGNLIYGIFCQLPKSELESKGKVRFITRVVLNNNKVLTATSQTVYVK